jgi:hypothetical protein
MKTNMKAFALVAAAAALVAWPMAARAADEDVNQLKKEVSDLQKKVDALEKAPASINVVAVHIPEGVASAILARDAMNDQQEAAPRVDNQTLDPKYTGFIPVPNTEVIMKFNAKPHVDITADSDNSGDSRRFVTARIPVDGDPDQGGGEQFNVNANASQLKWDVRAPNLPGAPRFYYQNDFFGDSQADMKYRLQHLYGSIYNVVAGFTYGVFEDPDIWPDTVDYEGPNAVNFSRRPLVQYKKSLGKEWTTTLGLEKPDIYIDTTGDDTASTDTPMPDLGANLRWENADAGHMQLSGIARDIAVESDTAGDDDVFGWGFNLGGTYNVTKSDTLLALANYGEGIGGMGNDTSFVNSDAAFDADGNLEALPYWSGFVGLTHKWSEKWRSTVTYGYVELDNSDGQAADAYHTTTYASANIICQVRKQMSVGLEGLYGEKETKDGSSGDVFRAQLGLVYSLF